MEKTMELLAPVAEQLGVTIEYLWETLVRQQYVNGTSSLIIAAIEIIIIIILSISTKRLTKLFNKKLDMIRKDRIEKGTGFGGSRHLPSNKEDTVECLTNLIPVLGIIAILVFLLLSIFKIKNGILHLLNPDYYALKEIIDVISNSGK